MRNNGADSEQLFQMTDVIIGDSNSTQFACGIILLQNSPAFLSRHHQID
jgi:hypothetical protein